MEIGQFLRSQANGRGKLPLSVAQFPSKRFGFVGSVPVDLMWEYESADDVKCAVNHGPGLARRVAEQEGRVFGTRTWDTAEDAKAAAAALGFTVAEG